MDIEKIISNAVNDNFNKDNQFLDYFVSEMNKMNLGLDSEQAQHLFNIFEFVAKSAAKNGAIIAINAMHELRKH